MLTCLTKMFSLMTLFLALVVNIFLLGIPVPVEAHTPDAPRLLEVKLAPFVIYDGEKNIEISSKNFSSYYYQQTGEISLRAPLKIITYRALEVAFNKLWEKDEIPHRADLHIVSNLPAPESVYFLKFVTATGPGEEVINPGVFQLLSPEGTAWSDLSLEKLKDASLHVSEENIRFVITNLSVDKSIELVVKKGVFPQDFFELRQKILFACSESPSRDEVSRHTTMRLELIEKLITLPAGELFEGVAKESVSRITMLFVGLLTMMVFIGTVIILYRK